MNFNHSNVPGVGFENDIYVDAKCDYCGRYYNLLLIVDRNEARNDNTEIGKQLKRNGCISFEECGECTIE